MKRILCCVLPLIGLFWLTGCESANRDESNIPWNRPASWEGGPAGYGEGLPGRERY
ncbi:MAG: hypothetical protein AAGF10_04430 [Verrucomicrobiota bacterium]